MDQPTQEFSIKLTSKFALLFLFLLVGSPMIYVSVMNFDIGQTSMGISIIIVFITWGSIIAKVIHFKIKLSNSYLEQQGLFSSKIISFEEIDAIHFGSGLSNFYVRANDEKVYISKDFDNYEYLLEQLITKIVAVKNREEIAISGKSDDFERYGIASDKKYPRGTEPII